MAHGRELHSSFPRAVSTRLTAVIVRFGQMAPTGLKEERSTSLKAFTIIPITKQQYIPRLGAHFQVPIGAFSPSQVMLLGCQIALPRKPEIKAAA